MQNPKNLKYFAFGVLVSAGGALLAEVVRSVYRNHIKGAIQ